MRRGKRAGKNVHRGRALRNIEVVDLGIRPWRSKIARVKCNDLVNCKELEANRTCAYQFPVIIFTNVRSVLNKVEQLGVLMETYKPEVLALCETWMSVENENAFGITGYHVYHRLRIRHDKSRGGGLSVYIKESLTTIQVEKSPLEGVEVITVRFRPKLLPREIPWYVVILVYYPPLDRYAASMIEYVENQIDILLTSNPKAAIFVLGDFNRLDMTGIGKFPNFKQIVEESTRGLANLDLCFTNRPDLYECGYAPPVAGSDHLVVMCSPVKYSLAISPVKITEIRMKRKSNYIAMNNYLAQEDWSMWSHILDVQEASNIFHNHLFTLYNMAFPKKSIIVKDSSHPWMNLEIVKLLKSRDIIFRKHPLDKIKLENLNRLIKSKIFISKERFKQSLSHTYFKSKKDFYKRVANLTKLRGNSDCRVVTFPNLSERETTNKMAEFYRETFDDSQGNSFRLKGINTVDHKIELLSEEECFMILKSLSPRASVPEYEVPISIYKEYAMLLLYPIVHLINLSLVSGVCPQQWKDGQLIPIPKQVNPIDSTQLRPIVLLSPLAKVVEKFILKKCLDQTLPIIDRYQFGGMPGRSVVQYLSIYAHTVLRNLEEKGVAVVSVQMDFQKAFDRVRHEILLCKLEDMGLSADIIQWLISYLHGRELVIKNADNYSEPILVNKGVPQGSVLGGYLFVALMNNFMEGQCHVLKYMDDISLIVPISENTKHTPQIIIDRFLVQAEAIQLLINKDKCSYICHHFLKKPIDVDIRIKDVSLKQVDSIKILGVIMQSDMKWTQQVSRMIKMANMSMCSLYKLRYLGIDTVILSNVYSILVRPHLEYCSQIWGSSLTIRQSNQIESIQRRATRLMTTNRDQEYDSRLQQLEMKSLEDRRIIAREKMAIRFLTQYPEFRPKQNFQVSGVNTRMALKLVKPKCRTARFSKSPVNMYIESWNSNM